VSVFFFGWVGGDWNFQMPPRFWKICKPLSKHLSTDRNTGEKCALKEQGALLTREQSFVSLEWQLSLK
jgi:hypothetical protein